MKALTKERKRKVCSNRKQRMIRVRGDKQHEILGEWYCSSTKDKCQMKLQVWVGMKIYNALFTMPLGNEGHLQVSSRGLI